MPHVRLAGLDQDWVTIDADVIARLASALSGGLLQPGAAGYDEARTIWNAMIDRRPALIARCASAADVQQTVRFAAAHRVLTSIRGGGHNIAGNAVCEGGLMIDLSPMNAVGVDAPSRTARVQPGATLAAFDAAAQAHGLATPLGINSTTGVAGLTLGGGFGWLTRKHGLTIDNLLSAEVVTADGEIRTASDRENPDLFWALRGGGGNFGVVTSFEFRLHPVGPEVYAGLVVHPFSATRELMRHYRSVVATTPDELSCWLVFRKAPPLPFIPPEWHGREVAVMAIVYAGSASDGPRVTEALRSFGTPVGEHLGPVPYTAFQQAFDPLLTPGARNYWKSHDFTKVSDEMIEGVVEYASKLPTPQCEIFIGQLGGAAARVPPEATAFGRRDAEFIMNVHTRWDDAADDRRCIAWARELFDAMAPHALGTVYVNFMPEDEQARVPSAFGPNYGLLAALKTKYDPTNLFRMNQNIQPSGV
jgi:FAD/FMN-containing dehydrogenase